MDIEARNQPLHPQAPLAPPPPPPPPPGPGHEPPPRRRSSFGFIAVIMIVLALGAATFLGLLLIIGLAAGAGNSILEVNNDNSLREKTVISGASGTDAKIALISLSGAIFGSGSYAVGSQTVFELTRQLRKARKDANVKAVLLQVNSPGGGLTASDLIYHEVRELRKIKPVVVWVGDMAASGGYYIAAPSNYIVASPTSIVGSIGVIMERFMVQELMEKKLGIKVDPIMAGKSKDIGSIFREMKPEERRFFERILKHFHDRFISVVAAGRGLSTTAVRKLADGRVYVPEEAKAMGLIDEIGYFDRALAKTRELSGAGSPRVVCYAKPMDILSLLQAQGNAPARKMEMARRILGELATPRIRAQWIGK